MSSSSGGLRPNRRRSQLRVDYSRLRETPISHPVTRYLDEDQWVQSNLLLDKGVSLDAVARELRISPAVAELVVNPRRCLEIHDGDTEALAKCLAGQDS